jgi:hypothetical protein
MEFIGTNWICPKCSGKATDPLLRSGLITMNVLENLREIIWGEIKKFGLFFSPLATNRFVRELAQNIFDKLSSLGYVRLEDMEIDSDKLAIFIKNWYADKEDERSFLEMIKEATGILRVKEGK